MGQAIAKECFQEDDYLLFSDKLRENLKALKLLLEQPGFGEGKTTVGAELEFYLVDQDGRPLSKNTEIADALNHPQLQVELNKYNLEYNFKKQDLGNGCLQAIEQEMHESMVLLNGEAEKYNGHAVPIGILPTLIRADFGKHAMTDIPRYRVLAQKLKEIRQRPFDIEINGEDSLHLHAQEMTIEGANTSVQFHWRVAPKHFVNCYNAVQLLCPVIGALASNSPSFLGKHLWDETRITLFKQSVDTRPKAKGFWRQPSRVGFGVGWYRKDALELFSMAATNFEPIIPIVGDEDPVAEVKAGRIPKLEEMVLHQGTTWPWNRAIYDHHSGGHLRIEIRSLPAGPTPVDMVANFAFLMGAAWSMREDIDELLPAIPFLNAEYNFYRAAQYGIQSKIVWPSLGQNRLEEYSTIDIAKALIPRTEDSLKELAVDEADIKRLMDVIRGRIEQQQTGSTWQKAVVNRYKNQYTSDEAFALMLQDYIKNQKTGKPVHEWSIE